MIFVPIFCVNRKRIDAVLMQKAASSIQIAKGKTS